MYIVRHMNKKTFQTFAQQIRAGDEKRFNTFLIDEYQKCKKSLRSLITSEEERHDAVLDAIYKFRKEYIDRQRLEIASSPSSYIYTIAKNIWFEKLRKQKKSLEDYNGYSTETMSEEPTSHKDEEEEDEKGKMRKLLHKAIQQLGKSCKDLITQHKLEGNKLKDLWESLGYPSYGACRKKHHKCQEKLYKAIIQLKEGNTK